MSVAKLLKFDVCPRLAGLPDCKIYVPRVITVTEVMEKLIYPTIAEKAIVDAWTASCVSSPPSSWAR